MASRKFAFLSLSEFEHRFEVVATTPEKAMKSAIGKCISGEGAPGVFAENFYRYLTELAEDGSPIRRWKVDQDGYLIKEW
jgi:hypothetical protein